MKTVSSDEVYGAVIRRPAHDAVRVLLAATPDSVAGSSSLRAVTDRLVAAHGEGALLDLAEELAVDLAEAFSSLAAADGCPALTVLDGLFRDIPALSCPDALPDHAAANRDGGRDRLTSPRGDTR